MNRKLKILMIVIVIVLLVYVAFYFTEYRHAQKQATDLLGGTDNVSVKEIPEGLFVDGHGNDTVLIFYPGAKNEYISYLPLCADLAKEGVDCYLVRMPLNFAFFGENQAEKIIDEGNYSYYFLSGHSLGGLSAASFENHTNKTDGIILLAGYPNSGIHKPVLSVYGSEDKILNMKAYNESKCYLDNLTEVIIEGGNHEQFAYYGPQEGDGVSKISTEKQLNETAAIILGFINEVIGV